MIGTKWIVFSWSSQTKRRFCWISTEGRYYLFSLLCIPLTIGNCGNLAWVYQASKDIYLTIINTLSISYSPQSTLLTTRSLLHRIWNQKRYQRIFLDWFAKESNIESQLGWYKVRHFDIIKKGGESGKEVLKRYGDNMKYMLESIRTGTRIKKEITIALWK